MNSAVAKTYRRTAAALVAARGPAGHWEGELSSSALATAVAVCALHRAAPGCELPDTVVRGLAWLERHANPDGGWGDTPDSPSNLSTTILAWSALNVAAQAETNPEKRELYAVRSPCGAGRSGTARPTTEPDTAARSPVGTASTSPIAALRAEVWLQAHAGSLAPQALADAVLRHYGNDRTFSAPILTLAALAGRLGPAPACWALVPQLPFELALLPHACFRWAGLPVVSYALPALIAIGLVRHRQRPPAETGWRCGLRSWSEPRVLKTLTGLQPPDGGFLEAIPLTGFVGLSLAACGHREHPVTRRCVEFLRQSQRADGSWPIDINLATWVTTLSIKALGDDFAELMPTNARDGLRSWLLAQQGKQVHPYTHAAPGGWAWTDLPGGVPDADDTAGALLALHRLERATLATGAASPPVTVPIANGLRWLQGIQNRDGGIPTFCRGWGRLPFDRSSPELTAHAIQAWSTWREACRGSLRRSLDRALRRAAQFLRSSQLADGSWLPLWFGNQQAPAHANPVYGTARVVSAISAVAGLDLDACAARGVCWLVAAQNSDGGWGGAPGVASSVEETSVTLAALAEAPGVPSAVLERGAIWLVERMPGSAPPAAAPIGLYFASLWYSEKLYPTIFACDALRRLAGKRTGDTRP